jgi:hypothetical protein
MNPRCLLAGLGLTLLPTAAHAQDCADLVGAVDAIAEALAQVEIDTAKALADQATSQLECQPEPVNTVMLTGLFQLTGAVAVFNGETADAEAAFARAVAISPTTPIDTVYGEDVSTLYHQVQRRLMDESGGALLLQGSATAWLDGRPVTMGKPVDVLVGHHLLQWQEDDGPMQAREIRVAALETRQLTLGTISDEAQRRTPRPAPLPSQGMSGLRKATLAGGAGGVVVGGVLLVLAAGAQAAVYQETDPDALEGIQARNHALAIGGLGLAALGAGSIGVSFFVHDAPGLSVGLRF